MYRYVLYADDDVIEFDRLDDAVAYAQQLLRSCQMQTVVIEQTTGKVVYPS